MSGTYTSTASHNMSGYANVDSLFYAGIMSKWVGPITYAFPDAVSQYSYAGTLIPNYADSIQAASTALKNAVIRAIDADDGNAYNNSWAVEGFTDLDISSGNKSQATIRASFTNNYGGSGATFSTGTQAWSGDMFFGYPYVSDPYTPQTFEGYAVIHEIGHSLGLKHPQDGNNTLDPALDLPEYTVMSYKYSNWQHLPQSYMALDIAALQHMYGADYGTRSGNDTYTWSQSTGDTSINGNIAQSSPSGKILTTIWDGGGEDTFDLSNYTTSLTLDLRPGGKSTFDSNQIAVTNNTHTVEFNVMTALLHNGNTGSLIENAKGAGQDDVLIGNRTANKLWGQGGNDWLDGLAGSDTLLGQGGTDTMKGGNGNDVYWGGSAIDNMTDVFIIEKGSDIIKDFQNGIDDILLGGDFGSNYTTLYNNATQSGGNLTLYGSNGSTLVIENFTKAQFTSDDIAAYVPGVLDPDYPDQLILA